MIIKTLKARILRALKSSLPAEGADSPPTKPAGLSVHADSFSDAREPETPTKGRHHPSSSPEPLDAWELVDQDGRAVPAPAAGDPAGPDPLLDFPRPVPAGRGARRGALHHDAPRRAADVRGLQRRARAAGEPGRGVPGARRVHGPGPPGSAVGGHGGEGRAPAPLRAGPRRRRRRPGARAPRGGLPRPAAAAVGADARRESPRLRGRRWQVRGVRGPELRGVRPVRRQPQGVRQRARCRACNENGLVMCPLCL